ncbi:MAG: dioxygenase [Myxococcales bacterium]|nr:MAG: dioxygenase [Myxococcales bacterium]
MSSLGRRRMLRWALGASLLPVLGCGGEDGTAAETSAGACSTIPEETAGPYPGDGSNGPNALTLAGIVRSDIRSSLGAASGTADGVRLTVKLTLTDSGRGCASLGGHVVYLWHCDREGRYSLYSQGVTDQNYLRGVQEADDEGNVTFTTVFPGCYAGRMPHIHFEVYPSLAAATAAGNVIATSQLALPTDACDQVYATSGYEASVGNLAAISFDSDNVFRDGVEQQLAAVTGSVSEGLVATLTVPVKA